MNEMEQKELSFWRARHDVDLVERAMENRNPVVICVAKSTSKTFISFKVIQEVSRREFGRKVILFVVQDEKVVDALTESLELNTNLVVTKNRKSDEHPSGFSFHPDDNGHHVVNILSVQSLQNLVSQDKFTFDKVALILLYDMNLPIVADDLFSIIHECVSSSPHCAVPKFVGFNDEVLNYQASPTEMKNFLESMKERFNCTLLVSDDLVAVNQYGERSIDKKLYYSQQLGADNISQRIGQLLQSTIAFLQDFRYSEDEADCINFLKVLFKECYQVLFVLGTWCASQIANLIAKEIFKFEKRVSGTTDELLLQFCRTQTKLIQSIFEASKTEVNVDATEFTSGLFQVLVKQTEANVQSCISSESNSDVTVQNSKKDTENSFCNSEDCKGNTESILHSEESALKNNEAATIHECMMLKSLSLNSDMVEQNCCLRTVKPNDTTENKHIAVWHKQTESNRSTVLPLINQTKETNKVLSKAPFAAILVKTPIFAQAVNLMINGVSNQLPEFSFLSSKFISGNQLKKKRQSKEGIDVSFFDEIMRNIQEGAINVLVATYDVEDSLHIPRGNLLVRFDVPKDYESFVKTKNKVRAANSRFVAIVNGGKKRSEEQYEMYQAIEEVLVPYFAECRQPSQLSYPHLLRNCSEFKDFIPNSEVGHCEDLSLVTSIYHINRYCSRFSSESFDIQLPRCKTFEEKETGCNRITSVLYMPRNCPLSNPFKGEVVISAAASDETISRAKLFSRMAAAQNACQALFEASELDQNFEPILKQPFPKFAEKETGVKFVVADGGIGRDGSVKRKRAYKRKYPSVLSDNLPVADMICHVYSLEIVLTKPMAHEQAVRSQFRSDNKLQLGLISKKPLPKLPGFVVYDRAGEVTVSPESKGSVVISNHHLQLIQRFHAYVFKHVLDLGSSSSLQFDPESQTSGYYVTLLFNSRSQVKQESSMEMKKRDETEEFNWIAFEDIQEIENSLGNFQEPQSTSFGDCTEFERFRDAVVTPLHMRERHSYYVADVMYGMSPLDEFPDTTVATTFQEYFSNRYDIRVNPKQPLLDVDHVSVRLNFLHPRYQNQKGKVLTFPQESSKRCRKSKLYLIPQTCFINPIPAHLWRQITLLPSLLYQFDALLLADEFRGKVSEEVGIGVQQWPVDIPIPLLTSGEAVGETLEHYIDLKMNRCPSGVLDFRKQEDCFVNTIKENGDFVKEPNGSCRGRDRQQEFYFDSSATLNCNLLGPSSSLLLRALTSVVAKTMYSYERLETFGDSFTKFAVSASIFFQHQHANEGKLSFLRGIRVSNQQLFYCGRQRQIASYMFVNKFHPLITWKPPGFSAALNESNFMDGRDLLLGSPLLDEEPGDDDGDCDVHDDYEDINKEEEEQGSEDQQSPEQCCTLTNEEQLNPMIHVCTSDKSIADATEALIGAYLITCGELETLRFMKWLEMDVMFPEEMRNLFVSNNNQANRDGTVTLEQTQLNSTVELQASKKEFLNVEDSLAYVFNDKILLLQAFTHISYPRHYNCINTNYENLEFLGDALLDYLVTRHLYFNHRHLDPHLMTDVRSAIVNNYSLAVLAVKLGLHKHLRALSPQLFEIINKFVKQQNRCQHFANPDHVYSSAFMVSSDLEGSDFDNIEVPKILGDLTEAVIGAIYVDSGLQVERVWQVLYPLLKDSIDYYSDHPPLSPVRQLMETMPNAVRFSPPEHMVDRRIKCSVKVNGVKRPFVGIGRNYKIAKSTAAQQALRHLASKS